MGTAAVLQGVLPEQHNRDDHRRRYESLNQLRTPTGGRHAWRITTDAVANERERGRALDTKCARWPASLV